MAYGLEILTSNGMQSIDGMLSAKLISVNTPGALSGSLAISGFEIAKGFVHVKDINTNSFGGMNTYFIGNTFYWSFPSGTTLSTKRFMFFMSGAAEATSGYGFTAKNTSGLTVISPTNPVLGVKSTTTLTGALYNSYYYFALPATTSTETIFAKLATSQYVSFIQPGGVGNPNPSRLIASNQSSLVLIIADTTPNLGAVPAYGMAVYNSSGVLTWHSGIQTVFIRDRAYVAKPASMPAAGIVDTLAGNVVNISCGCLELNSLDGETERTVRARKTGTDSIVIEYFDPTTGPGGSVFYLSALYAITGTVL